ncbi:MAG: aminoacyl-tRNA hydrolase [Syntrophales bacterium]|nr:aminoacyl-tRNA hydrolase [Syntrophales bacterium]
MFIRRLKRKFRYFRAIRRRRGLDQVTFIGITGSAGKTTVTDLAAAILAESGPCRQTRGSNTAGPIAKVILQTDTSDRYCIVEMGTAQPGSLDLPARLVMPKIAVITVIGLDHYSAFRSKEAIAAEKEKVVLALPQDGTAVLNIDDPLVREIGERCKRRVIWFGSNERADLRLLEARSRWPEPLTLLLSYRGREYEARTQLHGVHMALPTLAALGIALAAGLPLERAIAAIGAVLPYEGRMQIVPDKDGIVFLRDDVKAPAWSLQAPLDFLREADAPRKVAVVGTLSDFPGKKTPQYKNFCRMAREAADLVVFIGPHAYRALRARRHERDTSIQAFPNIYHAALYLQDELKRGDLVLLKGSHKADHLVRLILNRVKPIACWGDGCDRMRFCGSCSKLHKPSRTTLLLPPMPLRSGSAVFVVAGLGNPGFLYRNTPHNLGFRVLDALARQAESGWQRQPEGLVCRTQMNGTDCYLFKPQTPMNNNGAMIRRFLERVGGDPAHCVIVHDDADLPLGDVRIKTTGGDGGHRGVRSVIAALGAIEITRVCLGIRPSGEKAKARNVVLRKSMVEKSAFSEMIVKASAMAGDLLRKKIDRERGTKVKRARNMPRASLTRG